MPDAVLTPGETELVERILAETPIGMTAAARLFGTFKNDRPVHPSTVTRWATAGVLLPDGSRLRLEAVRVCGRLVTSRPAVVRFLAAQQQDPAVPEPARSAAERRRGSTAAEAELDAVGIR